MNELDAINKAIKETEKVIEAANAVKRLMKNKDFTSVVTDGYFKEYAADLVKNRMTLGLIDDSQLKFIEAQMTAVGGFSHYLELLLTSGVTAEAALASHEAERSMLLNEEE